MSGNPGGLPAKVREARALAAEHSPKAINRLATLLDHEDPRVAIAAAEALLDRAGVSVLKAHSDVPAEPGPPLQPMPAEVMVGILMEEQGHDPAYVREAQESRLDREAHELARRREAIRNGTWRKLLGAPGLLPDHVP